MSLMLSVLSEQYVSVRVCVLVCVGRCVLHKLTHQSLLHVGVRHHRAGQSALVGPGISLLRVRSLTWGPLSSFKGDVVRSAAPDYTAAQAIDSTARL